MLLVALGICGYWLLFSQFMVYDDEGYVLWSLHNYFLEGGLYGPFIYTLYHGIHMVFGLTFDNETGRLITLFYWLGASALTGWFTWRQTRSAIMAGGTICFTFGSLLVMTSEPIHPGGILTCLSAIGAVGGAVAIERKDHRLFAVICGAIGAAMLLTKINVGVFFLIAAGSWMAMNSPHIKLSRACLWVSALGSLLAPYGLMHKLWPDPWVAIFALLFSLSALSLLLLFEEAEIPRLNWKVWPIFIGASAFVTAVVLGMICWRGTSLPELWQGVVMAPLGQPLVYAHAINWPRFIPWLAVGLFIFVLSTKGRHRPWFAHVIVATRLLMVMGFIVQTYGTIENLGTSYSFLYGLPFVWVMLVPLHPQSTTPERPARLWLAWVFLWQTLHAYPVAGSQLNWGSFLWVPLAMVGCHEAICFWAEKTNRWESLLKALGYSVVLACSVIMVADLAHIGHYRYSTCQPLGLKGAEHLRLSDNITGAFRVLDENIRQHGGLLFSYPGMFSYNLWSGHPTPTAANVTHWFSLLTDTQQQEIVDKLKTDERAVLIVQDHLINFLLDQNYAPEGILKDYLLRDFTPAFRMDAVEFWVKKGRTIAPVSTVKMVAATGDAPAMLELVTAAQGSVASVELRGLNYPYHRVAVLVPHGEIPWEVTDLHPDNSSAGPVNSGNLPLKLSGISQIRIPLDNPQNMPPRKLLEVVLLDASGHLLDTLQFIH